MDKIKLSLDNESFYLKPNQRKVSAISKRIGGSPIQLSGPEEINKVISKIGAHGYTFSPATFKNGQRKKENFEQQQLFVLDFDNKESNKTISFEEAKIRADYYELPILFAYDTLSSINHNKFRIVFLNDIPIPDRKIAEAMQLAIGTIFPESDSSCYKDISRIYFGGKHMLLYDKRIPEINVELVFRSLYYYLRDKYGLNHYKEKLTKFSKETGIALNNNGILDVTTIDNPTEYSGAFMFNQNRKNSPSAIIYTKSISNIKANGEIFPIYYHINSDCTNSSSVGKTTQKSSLRNHKPYRSSVIKDMSQKCRLFKEFENGERKLHHSERFGILTNLIPVETGTKKFLSIISENMKFYADTKDIWKKHHIPYQEKCGYRPTSCSKFCPYHNECTHSTNILSTVYHKRGNIEKVSGYSEKFYPLTESQEDTYHAICKAYKANDKKFHIIKSMTSVGKTTSYLKLMSENPTSRFLIAAPTNLLKDEIFNKAKKLGIEVLKTPSLQQISDEMPDKIWNHIQKLYNSGQYNSVYPYIENVMKKKNISCLKKYMEEREKLMNFKGNIITTQRYLLNMEEKRLKEYDAIIIDEDIIFKSIIPNQIEISKKNLKKLLNKVTDSRISKKIKLLLKLSKTQSCIEVSGFDWSYDKTDDNDKIMPFDIPSFCLTEKFYLRKASKDNKLEDDTFVFLRPEIFKNVKYIIVSATVNKNICREFFGNNINFYECKKTEYKGELLQYPRKSMSRTSIANNPGIVRRLMKHFDIEENKVITFMKENIGQLHFGNTEGSNTLEGEDILVIGTPYHADFLYKLAAFTMELDFDENEEMTSLLITHNGYRFWFTTFKNENLREIHFWMIESELEQAVGRARLLRNRCKVRLFSNFPLSQAKMIYDFNYNKEIQNF